MPVVQIPWRAAALRVLPAVVCMGVIFALSSRSTLPKAPGLAPELISIAGHFTVYAVLAMALWWGLGIAEMPPGRRLALAFAGALLYGLSDEWHQSFVPGRDTSMFDIVVDAAGALCGLVVVSALLRFREDTPDNAGAR